VISHEQAAETFVQFDFDGIVSYISSGTRTLIGYEADEVTGANLAAFVHPQDRDQLAESWRALREGCDSVTCTYRTCHKDTRQILTESTFRLVRDAATGIPREMVGVMREASSRLQLYGAIDQSSTVAQMLVESAVDYAIYLLDLDGTVKSWNAGAERIKGYCAQEIIGSNFSVFYTDDDVRAGEPMRALLIARATGRYEAEGWRLRKDRTRLWASVVIDAIRNPAGEVVGFTKITRDVTESVELRQGGEQLRVQSEQLLVAKNAVEEAAARLVESAERDRALNETNRLMAMAGQIAHVAHWRIDLRANELIWSDEIYRIVGRPRSYQPELEDVIEFYHPDDRLSVRGCVERAITDGIPFSFEARIAHTDTSYRDVTCSGQIERADDGEITGLLGVFQDITERKAAERERERLIMRVNLATQGARVGIWEWNIAANTFDCDPMQHILFGFDAGQFFPDLETWTAAIADDDRERVVHELTQALTGGAPYDTEFRVVWPNGEVHHMRAMATVVRGESGSPERMIGTNWDVTEVRTLTEELRREQAWLLTERGALVRVSEQLCVTADRDRATAATLLEKNRLLAMAEQLARTGHWRLDLIRNELYWSDEMYRTFGLPTTFRPTLQDAIAAYHPDDREEVSAAVRHAIAEGTLYTKASRVVRPDGTIRHVISTGQSERGVDGTAIALFGVFQDVTETKDAERERLRLLERVSVATQAAQVGIWDWDVATDSLVWDPTMFALYGFDDAAFVPVYARWAASLHTDDRLRAEHELAQAVVSGATWETEFRVVWPNGDVRNIRAMATVVRAAAGSPERMVGTNWDVTQVRTLTEELRQEKAWLLAERAASLRVSERLRVTAQRDRASAATLREKNRLLAMAEQMAKIGYWRFDLRTQEVYWSDEVYRTYGLPQSYHPTLESVLESYHPDDRAHVAQCIERGITDGTPYAFEARVVQADGTIRNVLATGQTDRAPEGQNIGLFGVLQDVTELKETETRLEALNTVLRARTIEAEAATVSKSQFLANMSHEIRSPMNAILGMLQLLQTTGLSAQQADYAVKAHTTTQALLRLLNDILDFSKVEAGKLTFENAPFEIEAMMRDVSSLLSASLGAKPVELVFAIDKQLPTRLHGDVFRLRQVLLNLAGNAIKFTTTGEIVIEIRQVAGGSACCEIEFSVRDTGIGIAPEQLTDIFEEFNQGEASTTRRYGGTGLGLAISQRIVSLMGGQLDVESEVGRGSRFHFTLSFDRAEDCAGTVLVKPLTASALISCVTQMRADRDGVEMPLGRPATPLRLRGLKVLVVDDFAINLQIAGELLSIEGAEVEVADSSQGAIDTVLRSQPPFDVVLMDVQMPEMDGYETTRRLRELPQMSDVAIIGVTANAMEPDKAACLAAGMDDHLPKPMDIDVVVSAILRHSRPAGAPRVNPVAETTTPLNTDVEAALWRLGNNRSLFATIAGRFIETSDSLIDELRAFLRTGALSEATKLLHQLKGFAGTVGNVLPAQLASRLETELKRTGCLSNPHADLARLESLLAAGNAVLAAVIADFEAAPRAPEAARELDPTAIETLLVEIDVLLRGANMRAVGVCADLQRGLSAADAELLAPLVQAIGRLDFAQARSEVTWLRRVFNAAEHISTASAPHGR
jgi:PAS domain S-box-containing protein